LVHRPVAISVATDINIFKTFIIIFELFEFINHINKRKLLKTQSINEFIDTLSMKEKKFARNIMNPKAPGKANRIN